MTDWPWWPVDPTTVIILDMLKYEGPRRVEEREIVFERGTDCGAKCVMTDVDSQMTIP